MPDADDVGREQTAQDLYDAIRPSGDRQPNESTPVVGASTAAPTQVELEELLDLIRHLLWIVEDKDLRAGETCDRCRRAKELADA